MGRTVTIPLTDNEHKAANLSYTLKSTEQQPTALTVMLRNVKEIRHLHSGSRMHTCRHTLLMHSHHEAHKHIHMLYSTHGHMHTHIPRYGYSCIAILTCLPKQGLGDQLGLTVSRCIGLSVDPGGDAQAANRASSGSTFEEFTIVHACNTQTCTQ